MIGVLTPSVFALDLLLPKGYSVWALYLVPLLLTAWLPFRWVPIALASTCTVLVILRFVLPASAVPQWVSASNRAVGIAVMWVVAILLVSRKRAEAALQESEARFRQMADTVQEVFWMAGPSVTETLYVSPAYERLWGRTRESLRASPTAWIEAIHPDDRPRALGAIQRYREAASHVEYRIVRPDGSVRWVWDHGYPVLDERGELVRIVGIAADITERKEMEQALKEQSRLLRAVLDSVADGVIVADEAGRLVLFNRGAEDQHGGLPMNGLPFREWPAHYGLYLPDRRTPYPAEALPLMRAVRGESVDNVEVFVRNDGVPEGKWALVSGRPIIDDEGRSRGGVIVRRDITERKVAERRLAVQYAVTGILAESAGTADTIGRVLRVLCDGLDWDLGAYWAVDAAAGLLRCEVLWWRGNDGEPVLDGAGRQATRPPGAGLPGHVWTTGRPAWVPDVHADESPVQGAVVVSDRLHGALAFPVRCDDQVLGVFDLASREPRPPDAELLKMLDSVGSQIGQLLVRKRAEAERERLVEALQGALAKVKTLKGLLPLCSSCQKVRDARGRWRELEDLVCEHLQANFRQDLCPSCAEILFPGFYKRWNKHH